MTKNPYSVKRLSNACIEVRMRYKAGFRQSFFLSSDHHFDNPKTDQKQIIKDLKKAKEQNAGIFIFGDLFCLMQGKGDYRGSKADVRPEHQNSEYFTAVKESANKLYSPFWQNIIMVSEGNHESAIKKRLEFNIIKDFLDRGNAENNNEVFYGNYSGYIRFVFEHESGGQIRTKTIFYHHGYGGGSGHGKVINRAAHVPDANILVSGHLHKKFLLQIDRERLDGKGNAFIDTQHHLQLGTYKEEYLKHAGYHIEKGRFPASMGGSWLDFELQNKKINYNITL